MEVHSTRIPRPTLLFTLKSNPKITTVACFALALFAVSISMYILFPNPALKPLFKGTSQITGAIGFLSFSYLFINYNNKNKRYNDQCLTLLLLDNNGKFKNNVEDLQIALLNLPSAEIEKLLGYKNDQGNTILRNAVLEGDMNVVQFLVENYTINLFKEHIIPNWWKCIQFDTISLYSPNLLVKDINNRNNALFLKTPLFLSVINNKINITKYLMEKMKGFFSRKTDARAYLLLQALHLPSNERQEMVDFFVEKYENNAQTELDYLLFISLCDPDKNRVLIKNLLKLGADCNVIFHNTTSFDSVLKEKKFRICELLVYGQATNSCLEQDEMVDYNNLQKKFWEEEYLKRQNWTPLHYVCEGCPPYALPFLGNRFLGNQVDQGVGEQAERNQETLPRIQALLKRGANPRAIATNSDNPNQEIRPLDLCSKGGEVYKLMEEALKLYHADREHLYSNDDIEIAREFLESTSSSLEKDPQGIVLDYLLRS